MGQLEQAMFHKPIARFASNQDRSVHGSNRIVFCRSAIEFYPTVFNSFYSLFDSTDGEKIIDRKS
jgi:hypothetical protein